MRSAKDPMAIFSRSLPKATADSAGDAATIRDLATGTTKTIAEQRRSRPPLFAPSRRRSPPSNAQFSANGDFWDRMNDSLERASESLAAWLGLVPGRSARK